MIPGYYRVRDVNPLTHLHFLARVFVDVCRSLFFYVLSFMWSSCIFTQKSFPKWFLHHMSDFRLLFILHRFSFTQSYINFFFFTPYHGTFSLGILCHVLTGGTWKRVTSDLFFGGLFMGHILTQSGALHQILKRGRNVLVLILKLDPWWLGDWPFGINRQLLFLCSGFS